MSKIYFPAICENYAGSGTTDLSFTGQNQDLTAGLYEFLYRRYSAVQGRWISPDPAGIAAVSPANPQSWNRYANIGNMPTGAVDPLGLWRSDVFNAPRFYNFNLMQWLGVMGYRTGIRGDFRLFILCCFCHVLCSTVPAQQPQETQPPGPAYTFKSNVNVVVVPVVVRDKQGRALGDLRKEDFQIFDNGKPQAISGFTIQKREGIEGHTPTVPGPAHPNATSPPKVVPDRFIVFLFDDMHLSIGDLAQVQKAGIHMLTASLADTDMAAIVSMSGNINSGLTTDRSQLELAITKLRAQNLYRVSGSEWPPMDYYHADLIENKHNSNALEAAVDEVMSCSPGIPLRSIAERLAEAAATQAVVAGEMDAQITLAAVKDYVRRMATLPGQRILILVSPGFLTLTNKALSDESEIMNAAADSNVTISALDARGLYVSEMDASERGGSSSLSSRLKSEYRRNWMSLNENVMGDLAAGTGGTYFHNSNDLQGGFQWLTAGPEYLYLLEFSIGAVKQNGSYHRLKVKVDRDHVTVQSRRGYSIPKPPKKKNKILSAPEQG